MSWGQSNGPQETIEDRNAAVADGKRLLASYRTRKHRLTASNNGDESSRIKPPFPASLSSSHISPAASTDTLANRSNPIPAVVPVVQKSSAPESSKKKVAFASHVTSEEGVKELLDNSTPAAALETLTKTSQHGARLTLETHKQVNRVLRLCQEQQLAMNGRGLEVVVSQLHQLQDLLEERDEIETAAQEAVNKLSKLPEVLLQGGVANGGAENAPVSAEFDEERKALRLENKRMSQRVDLFRAEITALQQRQSMVVQAPPPPPAPPVKQDLPDRRTEEENRVLKRKVEEAELLTRSLKDALKLSASEIETLKTSHQRRVTPGRLTVPITNENGARHGVPYEHLMPTEPEPLIEPVIEDEVLAEDSVSSAESETTIDESQPVVAVENGTKAARVTQSPGIIRSVARTVSSGLWSTVSSVAGLARPSRTEPSHAVFIM